MITLSATNMYVLETERLALREFEIGDTDFVIRLLNSPGWLEQIGDRNVRTKAAAEDYLTNRVMPNYAQHGFGVYVVLLKPDLIPIGNCGLIRREGLEHTDIGFAFLPEYMGKGYAYESASACVKWGMEELKLPQLQAITLPTNTASIRLIEKLGMHKVSSIHIPNDDEELWLFELLP